MDTEGLGLHEETGGLIGHEHYLGEEDMGLEFSQGTGRPIGHENDLGEVGITGQVLSQGAGGLKVAAREER